MIAAATLTFGQPFVLERAERLFDNGNKEWAGRGLAPSSTTMCMRARGGVFRASSSAGLDMGMATTPIRSVGSVVVARR